MARERSEAAALFDMLQAAEATLRHVAGRTRDDYERDELLRHAVERTLGIIGEAARSLSQQFIDQHPAIPWRAVMATRHILIPEYDEVDNDIVWRITQEHVPELIRQLRPLLPPPPVSE
jgi:uncharacterized protein with HEPN domain